MMLSIFSCAYLPSVSPPLKCLFMFFTHFLDACVFSIEFWEFFMYPTEKAMAPHSNTLAWKIPWTEEPGGLQSMGSLGVGHDWATSFSLFTSWIGEGNGNPLPCSCLENPKDGGACWAAICGVKQNRTWLKWQHYNAYHAPCIIPCNHHQLL